MISLFSREKKEQSAVDWQPIHSVADLDTALEKSHLQPIIIFKHSNRCPISSWVLDQFEKDYQTGKAAPYFLDLITYRHISEEIGVRTGVVHESPQVILIQSGSTIYHASHNGISFADVVSKINEN